MKPIYAGYYTKDNLYTKSVNKLIKQLNQFNLEYCFTEIEKTSWQKATQYKPKYLLGLHKMYKGRPMVYLDADSRILRYPELFDRMPECDIATHIADWSLYKARGGRKGSEMLNGVIYLPNNNNTERILNQWIEEIKKTPDKPEHRCLERVILNSEYSHFNLPPQYCCIFDHMAEAKNPAILQMQLSRQRKRKRVKPQFI